MIVNLAFPSGVVTKLAGATGRSSETSGLDLTTENQTQIAAYIGGVEARQFWRSGSLVSASFRCVQSFDTVEDAEAVLLTMPRGLINQSGVTAGFGSITATGTAQVETATAAGTATGAGNVTVTVVGLPIGTVTANVEIASGDTATVWAGKVRTALAALHRIRAQYIVSGTGADIVLTARFPAANDTTLNIALANGTPSPGITPAATSTNTTAGVADSFSYGLALYDAVAIVSASQQGAALTINVSITGRTTAP